VPVPAEERARHIIAWGYTDADADVLPFLDAGEYRASSSVPRDFIARDASTVLFERAVELAARARRRGALPRVAPARAGALERALDHTGLRGVSTPPAGRRSPEAGLPPWLHHLRAVFDVAAPETLMIGTPRTNLQMRGQCRRAGLAGGVRPRIRARRSTRWRRSHCCATPSRTMDWLRGERLRGR